MTISNSEQELDLELRRYLLGQLSAGEQDSLEDRYFADDSLLEQLLVVETELLEDYVAGRLSAPTREQFERNYLTTDDKQERVTLVRELQTRAQSAARARAAEVPRAAELGRADASRSEGNSWWQKIIAALVPSSSGWRHSLAYGFLILLIGTAALSVYTINLRRRERAAEQELVRLNRQRQEELAQLTSQQKEAQRSLEAARSQADALAQALDSTVRKPPLPEKPDAEVLSAAIGSSSADGSSIAMPPGPGGNAEHIVIPPQARLVRLTIRFPSREQYEEYFVSITGPDGREVLGPQRARHATGGSAVTIYAATKLLNKGSYILTVTGHNRDATPQPVAIYRLEVVK